MVQKHIFLLINPIFEVSTECVVPWTISSLFFQYQKPLRFQNSICILCQPRLAWIGLVLLDLAWILYTLALYQDLNIFLRFPLLLQFPSLTKQVTGLTRLVTFEGNQYEMGFLLYCTQNSPLQLSALSLIACFLTISLDNFGFNRFSRVGGFIYFQNHLRRSTSGESMHSISV